MFLKKRLFAVILVLFSHALGARTGQGSMRNISGIALTTDMGQGWNLGNTLDAYPGSETSWGNPLTTKAMVDSLSKKGFKTLRIPTTWFTHVGPEPTYTIDPKWLDRVEEIMNYAFENDMYVILNIHHDEVERKKVGSWLIPTFEKQAVVTDELVKLWTQLAHRFIDYDDHLLFEIMNEPRYVGTPQEWTGGTAEGREVINAFNLAAVKAIRKTGGNNAKRFIMCPAYAANSGRLALEALVLPKGDPRIVVSIHNYGPYSFCMEVPGTTSWGTPADKAAIDKDLDTYHKLFVSKGIPVVIGEWGSVDKNNTPARATHAAYFVQAARARNIATVWWDNGALSNRGFALLNRRKLDWYFPDVVNAIVQQ